MNKDLEIIKHNEPKQIWNQEDGDFYLLFVPEMWDIVIQAAERMAAEIARLKKFIEDIYNNDAAFKKLMTSYEKISKSNAEYRDEITRLKAELEKRPEVVRCVECINYHGGIYTSAEGVESSQPPCCYYFGIHVNNNDFCFRGQRRESEEGEMSDFTKCKNCYFLEPEEFILNAFYCDWDGHTTNLEDQCSNNKFVNNNKEKQEARDE